MAKRPAEDADRLAVVEVVLRGLAAGEELADIDNALRDNFEEFFDPFPGDVICELGADALAVAGVSRSSPADFEDLRGRYLSEFDFRGKTEHAKSKAAINLVVGIHAGIVPDWDDMVGWWQRQDLQWWALLALLIMLRIAQERTAKTIPQLCAEIAADRGVTLDQ